MVFCASVTYPVDTGRFDLEYFATRHAPMFAELLGENCLRWEVFGRVLAEQGTAIHADIGQFSDAQPIRGWAEVR